MFMNDEQFRMALDFLMVMDGALNEKLRKDFIEHLEPEIEELGYEDWIEAYHNYEV